MNAVQDSAIACEGDVHARACSGLLVVGNKCVVGWHKAVGLGAGIGLERDLRIRQPGVLGGAQIDALSTVGVAGGEPKLKGAAADLSGAFKTGSQPSVIEDRLSFVGRDGRVVVEVAAVKLGSPKQTAVFRYQREAASVVFVQCKRGQGQRAYRKHGDQHNKR